MSRAPPEDLDVAEANIVPEAGDQYPPQSAQKKETQGESNFIDGSGPIFSMYMEMATEEDKKMAESWKDDADGILIFTGLFSAAVASLISVSIQDIRPDSQDTSNFYLSNIYQSMADPNITSSLPASPPPFSPPNYAIWVNAFWFLSLVMSITCALLATLLQQWARRYLKVTQPRYSPHKRARIRAFYAEGVHKFLLPLAVEALPTLLHVALFLFFTGLAVFLWNVDLTIFKIVLLWVSVCTALYGCITLVPLFRPDSPFHTPLSFPMWHFITGIRLITIRVLYWFANNYSWISHTTFCRYQHLKDRYRKVLTQGMQKTAEETALKYPPHIDTRSFLWTFDSLDEDHELERFFAGLPGFRSSKLVKDPLPDLTEEQQGKLLGAWIRLSDRTSSSVLLPEPVKSRRTAICARAFNPTDFPIDQILGSIVSEDQYGPVQSTEIARLVRRWDNENTTAIMQALVLSLVARAQRRDHRWFAMASDELVIAESVLRDHATHGDNLSLAILIAIVRQQFTRFWTLGWPWFHFSKVLEAASKFNVLDTSQEQQHEFCALWNQVVRKVQSGGDFNMGHEVLGRIRNVYVTLHQGTDSYPTQFSASTGDEDAKLWQPSAYPLCNIPDHHPDSTPHISDVSSPTTTAHPPASTPDALSSPVAALHFDESPVNVPLLNNDVYALFNPTRQAATEIPSVLATPSDPATAVSATRDIETSAQTIIPAAPATSTPTSVSPTCAVSRQNAADILVHSDAPEIPSSTSPGPVLDDITGTSPWPTSALELGATEGSPKTSSREDTEAPDPTLVDRAIQANTMAILDRPPLPQPLPSAADLAIAVPSRQGLDAEYTGDRPPHASCNQYNIV